MTAEIEDMFVTLNDQIDDFVPLKRKDTSYRNQTYMKRDDRQLLVESCLSTSREEIIDRRNLAIDPLL